MHDAKRRKFRESDSQDLEIRLGPLISSINEFGQSEREGTVDGILQEVSCPGFHVHFGKSLEI